MRCLFFEKYFYYVALGQALTAPWAGGAGVTVAIVPRVGQHSERSAGGESRVEARSLGSKGQRGHLVMRFYGGSGWRISERDFAVQ